ncbi:M55 family metallopeptidase [Paraburkholderia sacchari]|uniref:M55 family metallopeptidase n=1 Tax=Paraburkholderia sacchari TaxID=159450 RepID=UPI0005428770|nr:M55 family metallopeptidase [Paraburkholderia sacchari]NLP60655.1 M55 family metallopeptidase [Paraburkholderia sacchari]
MKILISTDIEGVAGVTHAEQTHSGNPEYERARAWMTDEANAAIQGAFEGGATQVLVNDSHGSFRNLLLDRLDGRAQTITGKPRYLSMMTGVELGCDAVYMLGYHSRAQTQGVLAHTINSFAFRNVSVNGQPFGEAHLYGALAGEFGVPVALRCGDDVFLAETAPAFPGSIGVQTKRALGNGVCLSLAPERACTLIREAAKAAVANISDLRPFKVAGLIECELTTQTPALADLFCQWPQLQRTEASALRFSAESMQSAVRMLNSLSAMSFMLR